MPKFLKEDLVILTENVSAVLSVFCFAVSSTYPTVAWAICSPDMSTILSSMMTVSFSVTTSKLIVRLLVPEAPTGMIL